MDTQPRKSTRSSKGKPPQPFNWTPHGKSWTVKSKQVILPRQIGRTRLHVMPCAEIKRSGLSHAGNGLYLSQGILRAGKILAEYKGEIISIDDANKLQMLVCSLHCSAFKASCREHLLHAKQLSDDFLLERARPLTSSVSEIPSQWCFNSAITDEYPMEWYVSEIGIAGFANTKSKANPKKSEERKNCMNQAGRQKHTLDTFNTGVTAS
jgi:hypothetical protein